MPPPPSSSIIAYWRFEEGNGQTRVDATGNGHDATQVGSNITTTTGVVGNGQLYPAISVGAPVPQPYLEVPDDAALRIGQADQTYWGWAKGVGSISAVVCYEKVNQIRIVYEGISPTFTTWRMRADFYYGGAGAFRRLEYVSAFDGNWHFWAVEYIASTKTINLYFDDFTTPVDTDTLPGGEVAATSNNSVTFGWATIETSAQDETGVANAVFTQDEKDCVFNDGEGGTFPNFCQGDIGWLFYMQRQPNAGDFTAEAYGNPTQIIFSGPTTGHKYYQSEPVVDTDDSLPGEEVEIKLVRDGTIITYDARSQAAVLLDIAIPTRDLQT